MPSKLEYELIKLRGEVSTTGKVYTSSIAALQDALTATEKAVKALETRETNLRSRYNQSSSIAKKALSIANSALRSLGSKVSNFYTKSVQGIFIYNHSGNKAVSIGGGAGVNDSNINVDNIKELNTGSGVTIDGNCFKDGSVETNTLSLTNETQLTIAAGVITPTQTFHKVYTQDGDATDDLDTITAPSRGNLLILVASSSIRDVVIKNNTGNIYCGEDITLDNNKDTVTLIWSATSNKWLLIANQNNL